MIAYFLLPIAYCLLKCKRLSCAFSIGNRQ